MKKVSLIILKTAFLLCVSVIISCQDSKKLPPEVGQLTVYYAKEDIKIEYYECAKGERYYDSYNFEINVREDNDNYIFEKDVDDPDGLGKESWSIPKSKIEKKIYKTYQLPAEQISSKIVFVSEKGCTASIFWSHINGHKYYSWGGKEEKWEATSRYDECFVLSAEVLDYGQKYLFEEQLDESHGFIKIYRKPFIGQELLIGQLYENWTDADGWGNRSAYSADGKLLTDQWEIVDIPNEISIAYLAEENALYINGDLYYKKDTTGE